MLSAVRTGSGKAFHVFAAETLKYFFLVRAGGILAFRA
jgi:hypothetical protein